MTKSSYRARTSNHNATSIKYDVMGRQWKVSRPYDTGSLVRLSLWAESIGPFFCFEYVRGLRYALGI